MAVERTVVMCRKSRNFCEYIRKSLSQKIVKKVYLHRKTLTTSSHFPQKDYR